MININLIREHLDLVTHSYESRKADLLLLDEVKALDIKWRKTQQQVDETRHQLKQMTPKGKPSNSEMAQLKALSKETKELESKLKEIKDTLDSKLLHLPNILEESVPTGDNETSNQLIRTVGKPKSYEYKIKSHDELAESLNLVDFERATKVSGSRFNIYTGMGAKLERALIQLMLDTHSNEHGYRELLPPALVNSASLTGTGQLPKFSTDSYNLAESDLWLSPTAEVQLTNYYRDEIIEEHDLPIKLTAYAPCFRKESGSYGKDVKGLIRLHQFNKVELVKLCHPNHSMNELELLLNNAEYILKLLDIPYRVMKLCSGDTGFSSAITYDIEAWFPSQDQYREISSCSNFFDFQSRRAMIRYRGKDLKTPNYVHTLNGSGLAVGRTFAAILENYQTQKGSVLVPEILQPYLNNTKEIRSL